MYGKSQEVTQMIMRKNGVVICNTNVTFSDSIIFTHFSVPNDGTGVQINGLVWASSNLSAPSTFAENQWDSGMFYQWSRPVGWSTTGSLVNSNGNSHWDSSMPIGDGWDSDNDPCPPGWRIPTRTELLELAGSDNFWGSYNGVNGRFFGSGKERIFLPAAGHLHAENGSPCGVETYGYYWSSVSFGEESAYSMIFQHDIANAFESNKRNEGISLRCVAE
jgi:uncharacterized protein (TIGR02145 family)